ncbi:MAG: TIGR03790 family protein [Methylococcaceae bacterium]|nr:TIGR03790 family protein [Methylococcaceae bacterium]
MVTGRFNIYSNLKKTISLFFVVGFIFSGLAAGEVVEIKNLPAWTPKDIAIIVNDNDSLSVAISRYYQTKRAIPDEQIIHVRFKTGTRVLTESEFKKIKQHVDEHTPSHVQGYVLTWLAPFRVDCMSVTTAFAAGFDKAFCAKGCQKTRHSPYFDSISRRPYDDFGWRPTMILAGEGFTAAKQLIDRGVAADHTEPKGSAYLLKTTDTARSSRAVFFPETVAKFKDVFSMNFLEKNSIESKQDVMFYFTGLPRVQKIATNRFLPGAVADHLTSGGGILIDSYQMSILEWIKAGATASYGAVIEPCNFPEKFPDPAVLMDYYLKGNSLIESYWKSVEEPGQGVFVGEPLAAPFATLKQ